MWYKINNYTRWKWFTCILLCQNLSCDCLINFGTVGLQTIEWTDCWPCTKPPLSSGTYYYHKSYSFCTGPGDAALFLRLSLRQSALWDPGIRPSARVVHAPSLLPRKTTHSQKWFWGMLTIRLFIITLYFSRVVACKCFQGKLLKY